VEDRLSEISASELDSVSNPNGIAAQSPRLLYSATLGHGVRRAANPNGVAARRGGCCPSETFIRPMRQRRKPTEEANKKDIEL